MEKCPLCGSAVQGRVCPSCGYEVPEESSLAAAYNYDPSDYPSDNDPLPEKKEIKYDMMGDASADDRSYINGSGAVNVKDGQYNASAGEDDLMPNGYSRANPAPYITKESSLQDDIRNFYALREAGISVQNGQNQNNRAGGNTPPAAGGNPYAGANNSGNPYANANTSANGVSTYSGANPAPYITKNSRLEDDISNFYALRAAGQDPPQGSNRIDFAEEQRLYNEKNGISFDNTESAPDPYEGLSGSEKAIRVSVDFIKKHWWKFLLLAFLPSTGFFIGAFFLIIFKREQKPSYILTGIGFIAAALILKLNGFGITGLDNSLLKIFSRL